MTLLTPKISDFSESNKYLPRPISKQQQLRGWGGKNLSVTFMRKDGGIGGGGGGEKRVVQELLVTQPSFALLGFLALSALPSVPATSWNVRWLMVGTSRQGSAAEQIRQEAGADRTG